MKADPYETPVQVRFSSYLIPCSVLVNGTFQQFVNVFFGKTRCGQGFEATGGGQVLNANRPGIASLLVRQVVGGPCDVVLMPGDLLPPGTTFLGGGFSILTGEFWA